jgi:FtsH-binding integral membrane protein
MFVLYLHHYNNNYVVIDSNQSQEAKMESVPLKQQTQVQTRVNEFIRSVYNWMAIGLALTGFVAYYVANTPALVEVIFGNRILFFGLIIGELALVFMISARIQKMQASTATALFVVYSILNGATLSFVFLVYTASSITSTFFICAATFVACSIYGWTTKRDLTSIGGFMTMGLIGIIIASVVNMFFRSSAMSMIISYIGVIVFVGLTAYDTQHLKTMAINQPDDLEAGVVRKGAILGALKLYLDFINLFLMLLRILGGNRN